MPDSPSCLLVAACSVGGFVRRVSLTGAPLFLNQHVTTQGCSNHQQENSLGQIQPEWHPGLLVSHLLQCICLTGELRYFCHRWCLTPQLESWSKLHQVVEFSPKMSASQCRKLKWKLKVYGCMDFFFFLCSQLYFEQHFFVWKVCILSSILCWVPPVQSVVSHIHFIFS